MNDRSRRSISGVLAACAALAAALLTSPGDLVAQEDSGIAVEDFAWITGAWEGTGPGDHEGETHATSIFTAPLAGVMSWTFRWHTPENGHVHFAFTVMETTESGVVSRGIHHGRDFGTFEAAAWEFRVTEATDSVVRLECVEHCRVRGLTFRLVGDDRLLEEYTPMDENAPLSVFEYRRVR